MIGTAMKAALLSALAAAAPVSGIELVPGRPATVDLGPAGTQDAMIDLRRGESAEIAVLQQGIDVVVEVRSPAGTLLQTVDSPNGRQGDEPVSLFAGEGGRYRIHVRPISAAEPAGQIVFRIVALRDRAETRALLAERRRAREAAAAWLRRANAALPAKIGESADAALQPFDALAADARVIGLGEATHGSREMNDLRLALVRRLVERHGYRLIALEDSSTRWRMLEAYLRGDGPAPAGPLLSWWIGLRSRQELLDWARAWNLGHRDDQVRIIGVDPQGHGASRDLLGQFLTEAYGEAIAPAWRERAAELAAADEKSSRFANSSVSAELRQYLIEIAGQLVIDGPILRRRLGDARYEAALAAAADFAAFADYNSNGGAIRHSRDRYMALAIMRAIDAAPGRKAIYWAHNAHVSAAATRWGPTGALLRQAYGCGYRAVASTFGQGGFVAQPDFGDVRLVASSVKAAPDETIEGVLRLVRPGAHLSAWDCQPPAEQLPEWLRSERPLHWIGGVYSAEALPGGPFQPFRLTVAFDAIAYLPTVTAEAASGD